VGYLTIQREKIALFRLDFGSQQSVSTGEGAHMDVTNLAPTLMMQLVLMRERLDLAASLGQAAEAARSPAISAKPSKSRSISNS